MYGTGDLVKWLPDGNIEFIGRVDDQVKIRGYRVELGELEAILQQSELVSQAVVVAREDKKGDKYLAAYIVPEYYYDKDTINEYLKERLPEYMIPSVMMELEALPLTANGKVNRRALPDPETLETTTEKYTAPRNATETQLVAIWEEILEETPIGIHDDFFELGGHSLLAVRLVSAIRKAFTVEMPIGDIFDYPTVALLSTQLTKQEATAVLPVIERADPRPERIPLSFSQERLWFIDQMGGSVNYHIPAVLRIKGDLDIDALSYALQQIVHRHEVLRTIIVQEDVAGYQVVKDAGKWQMNRVNGSVYRHDLKALQQFIKLQTDSPFNLSEDYMLRATLVQLEEREYILVVTLHHIASDGWSSSIIVKELTAFYRAGIEKSIPTLPVLPIQYADYAIWQRRYLNGELLDKKLGYWKEKLEGIVPLQLPTDYPRPSVQSTNGAMAHFSFDNAVTGQIQSLSQQQGTTVFMTLLSAIKVLLYRYSGQGDICIGTPIAGRQQQETEGLVGFFINTLVLRSTVAGSSTFAEIVQQVRKNTLEAYAHQDVPFEKVVETVVKNRDMSRTPIFQVMLVLQNTPEREALEMGDIEISRGVGNAGAHTTSKFDLTFNMAETRQGLVCSLEFNTDLYKRSTINRMVAHFTNLLTAALEVPNQEIGLLPMLDPAERNLLLEQFNPNKTAYPKTKSIAQLFEEQAANFPANTALVFGDRKISYRELNEHSNQLAHFLKGKGIKEETLVPVFMQRGPEVLVAILGILKAGGAYVPIDPSYPSDRTVFMLQDIRAEIILSSKESMPLLPIGYNKPVLAIDSDLHVLNKQPTTNVSTKVGPGTLAYVIYTSGSTGRPKGVMVTQQNVVSLVKGVDYVSLRSRDVLLSTGSLSFDATTFEYWGMLLNGGQLVMCAEKVLLDTRLLKEELIAKRVNIMWFTSSWFNQLVETDSSIFEQLETILVGGEKLSVYHVGKLRQTYPRINIINGYGPTENTTFSLTYPVTESDIELPIPIGKPLNNRSVLLLDENIQVVPLGVSGEICLAGDGLARGYLNEPELTAAKFIPHPFYPENGERIYRTGDIGRWLPDGNIDYLGRMDEQVKIRGYRIELGEIENVLQQSDLVAHAVVLARPDNNGNNRLVGYVVPTKKFDKDAVLIYLRAKLPEYMVPAVLIELDHLPLNANGKVNREALPAVNDRHLSQHEYVAPRNELELKLAAIWQELLGIPRAGIYDNFFEVGGHSLHALRLVAVIRKKMEVDISINDVFIYPTIAGMMGNYIEKIKNPSLPVVNIKYLVPLRTGGNKVPLYILAGGGGTALRFKKFGAMLGPDQPVFVLQPPIETKDLKDFPVTIEGIAGRFITEIEVHNPGGPYALSGHCLGGIIAFEMARQLQEKGKKVTLLAMFDTIIGKVVKKQPGTVKNLYHIPTTIRKKVSKLVLKVNFETFLLTKHTRQSVRYKLDKLKAFVNRINRNNDVKDKMAYGGLEVFDESADVYVAASKKYKLQPYTGQIVAFYAKEHYFFLDKNKNVGFRKLQLTESTKNMWKEYSNDVVIHEIEGEHSEIFDPVNGDGFATVLQQHLQGSAPSA